MAKPNARGPETRVDIYCAGCKARLYRYRKGGKGALVKCFVERIVQDYTQTPCTCPECGSVFARPALIRGVPAYKIIGGKVTVR